jgi:tetratricopeptide (TPR) repeat protein
MGDQQLPPAISPEAEDRARALRTRAQEELAADTEGCERRAILLLSDAIGIAPHLGALFVARARALLKLQEHSAAVRDCRVAIERSPQNASAFTVLGRSLLSLGRFAEAADALREAQRLDYTPELQNDLKLAEGRAAEERKAAAQRAADEADVIRPKFKPASTPTASDAAAAAAAGRPFVSSQRRGAGFEAPEGMSNPFDVLASQSEKLDPRVASLLGNNPEFLRLMTDPDFQRTLALAAGGKEGAQAATKDAAFLAKLQSAVGAVAGAGVKPHGGKK